ncbi:hypothetical protein BWQ96_01427 [Gracilariopsis chorda]|uniref:Uncharacterized protein n=1 Tax=Gracilariopsis chorda TaxID=448386 RepID=A0A2V3J349_9FLOR|nr:hypothetical protein BWQ96_01427 [Gracilariopsis chorda]|eukprot:PXF48871.1 hypothetical protein BWQ96_01427 [Gracilariopsis chorda]
MSLSTVYTRCQPPVCRRPRHTAAEPIRPDLDWTQITNSTFAAAVATFLSQIPSAPLDLASKLVQSQVRGAPKSLPSALVQLSRHHKFADFARLVAMGCVKRVPTKALTVAFFEIGTQILSNRTTNHEISSLQHLQIATFSGALAVAATFPLHSLYYASRKGVSSAHILRAFARSRNVMFSGAVPALASTASAVFVDYSIYKRLRTRIDQGFGLGLPSPVSIVAAATAANLVGGVFAEPFKAVSRRVAVESVKTVSCGSVAATTREMLQNGVGEFWRGYQQRVVRYAVSAVVSKTTVRQIRRLEDAKPPVLDRSKMVVAEKWGSQTPIYPVLACSYLTHQPVRWNKHRLSVIA